VTAAQDKAVNLAFLGANAMFRRTRLQSSPLGKARQVACYKTDYAQDPMYGVHNALVTSDWRGGPHPDPESSLIGMSYEGYPVDAPLVVASPKSWVFKGTGVSAGDSFPHLVGVEYDRVDPAYPLQRPIEVLSHSPLTCNGVASYGDSAYYTHAGGAGVFNCGTMRWVEALYGDQPHGIGGKTPGFVRAVTTNVLRAFAEGPAAAKAAASASDGTPKSARTRLERVATRSPTALSSACGISVMRRPSFAAAAAMPASPCFAVLVAIAVRSSALIPARVSAARMAASMSGAAAPRLQPIPATIMALSKPIASPAALGATRSCRRAARRAKSQAAAIHRQGPNACRG